MRDKRPIVFAVAIIITLLIASRSVITMPEGFLTKNWGMIFWVIVSIGILALIVFGLKKLGSSPSAAPAKTKAWTPSKWIWIALSGILFIGAAYFLLTYQGREKGEELFLKGMGFVNNATTVNFTVDSLKEKSWPELLPSGRYRVDVTGSMYLYKCPEDRGAASGYPEGKRADGGRIDGKTGGIILWSGIAPDNPQGNHGEFIVGPNDTIFARFDTDCSGNGTVVQTAKVSIQFSPVRSE